MKRSVYCLFLGLCVGPLRSTFSGAAAVVLGDLFPSRADAFWAQAKEASESRIYGMIHFRSDCETGLACGKNIGAYAIARGKADGSGL